MQNREKRIFIIGEVFLENHLDLQEVRLGGIFHSARMLKAIDVDYALAGIMPSYLYKDFEKYSGRLGASKASMIGEVLYSPNIMNIGESKKIGLQRPEDIYREPLEIHINIDKLKTLISDFNPTDVLIYFGEYDVKSILHVLKEHPLKIHAECQHIEQLDFIDIKLESIFISTSSNLFKSLGNNLFGLVNSKLIDLANYILLKENRGGSTLIDIKGNNIIEVPAFLVHNEHSMGVGDCYIASFISLLGLYSAGDAAKISAFYAGEYSMTFNDDAFMESIRYIEKSEILKLDGIRLPWDTRNKIHIYIAGPDFPNRDRTYFDKIESMLMYHNFQPHRPIKENGVYTGNEHYHIQQEMYQRDVELLEVSELMIAVLLDNDPGTLVEIGWMNRHEKPIILYDPFNIAHNLFLKKSVDCIVHQLDELIYQVYNVLSKYRNY